MTIHVVDDSSHIQTMRHIEFFDLYSRIADVRRGWLSQEVATVEARESSHCRFCTGVCSGAFLKFDVPRNWRYKVAHFLQTTQRIFGFVCNCWMYLTICMHFMFRRAGSVSCGKENWWHLQHPIQRGSGGACTTYRRTPSTLKWNGPKQTSKLCMWHSTPPCRRQAFIKRLVGLWSAQSLPCLYQVGWILIYMICLWKLGKPSSKHNNQPLLVPSSFLFSLPLLRTTIQCLMKIDIAISARISTMLGITFPWWAHTRMSQVNSSISIHFLFSYVATLIIDICARMNLALPQSSFFDPSIVIWIHGLSLIEYKFEFTNNIHTFFLTPPHPCLWYPILIPLIVRSTSKRPSKLDSSSRKESEWLMVDGWWLMDH